MKMIVVADSAGNIVATGHFAGEKGTPHARLHAGPGHTTHEVEVPDEVANIKSPEEFRKRLLEIVKLPKEKPSS